MCCVSGSDFAIQKMANSQIRLIKDLGAVTLVTLTPVVQYVVAKAWWVNLALLLLLERNASYSSNSIHNWENVTTA